MKPQSRAKRQTGRDVAHKLAHQPFAKRRDNGATKSGGLASVAQNRDYVIHPLGPEKMNDQQRRPRTTRRAGEIWPEARLKGNAGHPLLRLQRHGVVLLRRGLKLTARRLHAGEVSAD